MPTKVDREELDGLLRRGAQLLEVLPQAEFSEAHLPGAINIPLGELTPETAARLDRERPVVTYCYDTQCDMSPRAAWRLESLGFRDVYHYAPGKADWMGAGLPIEGEAKRIPMIGALADPDVPTCALETPVAELRRQLAGSDWDSCFVINHQRVVLGRVYASRLGDDSGTAEDLMDPGPSTFRPDITVEEMVERMRESDLSTAPVTSSDGRLIGLVRREDIEKAAPSTPHGGLIRENPAARTVA